MEINDLTLRKLEAGMYARLRKEGKEIRELKRIDVERKGKLCKHTPQ